MLGYAQDSLAVSEGYVSPFSHRFAFSTHFTATPSTIYKVQYRPPPVHVYFAEVSPVCVRATSVLVITPCDFHSFPTHSLIYLLACACFLVCLIVEACTYVCLTRTTTDRVYDCTDVTENPGFSSAVVGS